MSFNRNQLNPNIWDGARQNLSTQFANNHPQNFYGSENNHHFNPQRLNFFQQGQQQQNNIQSLSFNLPPGNESQQFRKFNNSEYGRNNSKQRNGGGGGGRNNFQHNIKRSKDNRNIDYYARENKVELNEEFNNISTTNERNYDMLENNNESRPKSLVEQLKSTMKKNNLLHQFSGGEISSDNVDTFAKNASKKLLNQIKAMDKGNVKSMIKNPKQPHRKTVLNIHAREKLREGMRKQLKTLGGAEDDQAIFFDADDSANFDSIPQTLIAQIGQELGVPEDIDLGNFQEEVEDKDMAVVEKNLGNDFLSGSEFLLMSGFSLLGESEAESETPNPPLPAEPYFAKPPEPVLSSRQTVTNSINVPWPISTTQKNNQQQTNVDDDWDLESAKNPDLPAKENFSVPPPTITNTIPVVSNKKDNFLSPSISNSNPIPVITSLSGRSTPSKITTASPEISSNLTIDPNITVSSQFQEKSHNESLADNGSTENVGQPIPQTPLILTISGGETPFEQAEASTNNSQEQPQPPQRSNETYGDYKRRHNTNEDSLANHSNNSSSNNNKISKNNIHSNTSREPRGPGRQNQNKNSNNNNNWNDTSTDNSSWIINNRRNGNERVSRFEQNRSRDRKSFNKLRSNSPRERFNNSSGIKEELREDINDGFNYRFQSNSNEGNVEKLNSIIGPKGQFKGSFNKRFNNRDRNRSSREKTPAYNEGEIDDFLTKQVSKDARPCYFMLKKVIEIDSEMTLIHDKILGIDKVIQNLQSERVAYQKKFSQLNHDRKVIFDSLVKRSHYNEVIDSPNIHCEKEQHRDKSRDNEKSPGTCSQRALVNKKLEKMVEVKKRKPEEQISSQMDDSVVKKKKSFPIEEPKSAILRQKEKEEKELKERLEKIRKQKQLKKEREEAERRKLEEEAIKTSNDIIIKLEKGYINSQKLLLSSAEEINRISNDSQITINSNEVLKLTNFTLKAPSINLSRINFSENIIEQFRNGLCPTISHEDMINCDKKVKERVIEIAVEEIKDPLLFEDNQPITNPPTPGNNLQSTIGEETEYHNSYEEWSGNFDDHQTPIVFLQNIDDNYMVCAAEDGKLFKYELRTGHVDAIFEKHSQICNSFLYDQQDNILFTASSDGLVFRINYSNFESNGLKNFNESLQVIEKAKLILYVGAKSGNIFRIKSDLSKADDNDGNDEPLCCVDGLILCLKASKEGPRSIILVASRGKAIQVRDATDGLLLRVLADEMSNVSVYDMALDANIIYCGCNLQDIFAIDFTNGALIKKRTMLGAGAICVKIHKQSLIAACYDGNIYIFDMSSDEGAVNISGPSNMLLAMDLWEDKIIASTKDKTVKIIKIPA